MKKWLIACSLLLSSLVHAFAVPAFYGPQKQVKVGKATIAYYRFGYGRPLLLVTGHGDAMTMWHPTLLKILSKNREVIMFDYPGIGDSTIEGNYPDSMAQLASLVQGFIDSQKLDKPDLLGFSMGGSLVLYMVAENGSKYGHIVAVGGKAGGKRTIKPDPKNFAMLNSAKTSPAIAIKTLLFPPAAWAQANEYLKVLNQMPPPKMNQAALKAQGIAVDEENSGPGIWQKLPAIRNSVLIMNGTEDVLTPVQNASLIAGEIPAAWLIQIKHTGHGVLFQEPEFTGNLIEMFLSY